ncbi:hypothetical protein [Pontiella sp.]|uniref:hypothetical protein n=1 Tax=Pontiella sp. TaxID=2837462 RepID=UPI003566773A
MKISGVAVVAFVVCSSAVVQATEFIGELKPFVESTVGVWIVPDAEELAIRSGVMEERYDGEVAFVGNIKGGLEVDNTDYVADLAAVGGFYAGPVAGLNGGIETSFRIKADQWNMTIGPHVGVHYYAMPTWIGDYDDQVDLDGDWGWSVGLKATVGKKLRGVLTIDYVDLDFDANGKSGGAVSTSKLDMHGIMICGGILF